LESPGVYISFYDFFFEKYTDISREMVFSESRGGEGPDGSSKAREGKISPKFSPCFSESPGL
jgi:hypothetical protein